MKKTIKKGFTLVELLFVMAIIAILAGFAIANLKDSTKVALENSLKNDIKNAISTQQTYFAANQSYESVESLSENTTNGITTGENGTKFTISKGNYLSSAQTTCSDGSIGFEVFIYPTVGTVGKRFTYNSCTDGSIVEEGWC